MFAEFSGRVVNIALFTPRNAPPAQMIAFRLLGPKKAWRLLENGEGDWSYQAMNHWPGRVREKCKTNKSYAIAHGSM